MEHKEIIKIILDRKPIQYRKNIYLQLLYDITHDADMNNSYGNIFIRELLDLFELLSETNEKAACIESIVRIIADLDNGIYLSENEVYNFYKKYICLLEEGYSNNSKMSETLSLFMDLNINGEEIRKDLIRILDEDRVVKILSNMNSEVLKKCKLDMYWSEKVYLYKKLCKRFDVILHFYLLINPSYCTNIEIAGEYLKKYYEYSIICADWIFSSKTSNYQYVKEGIISKEEYLAFLKIGDILNECKIEYKSESLSGELMPELNNISKRFQNKLNEVEIKELVNHFFAQKDFFEVAFTLPK